MNTQQVSEYLLAKPATSLDYPFGDQVQVFRVKNKMFATLALGKIAKSVNKSEQAKQHYWLNLKCDPDEAVMLRDIFESVIPGYHMHKALHAILVLSC
jgi:predicted DNA-binding protein (MmcQ/YjbR family)